MSTRGALVPLKEFHSENPKRSTCIQLMLSDPRSTTSNLFRYFFVPRSRTVPVNTPGQTLFQTGTVGLPDCMTMRECPECGQPFSRFFDTLGPDITTIFHNLMSGPDEVLRFLHRIFGIAQGSRSFAGTMSFQGPHIHRSLHQALKGNPHAEPIFVHQAAQHLS